MKKILLIISILWSINIFSQDIPADQIRADIDTVLDFLTTVHPTFYNSSSKKEIIKIKDTINHPMSLHNFFRIFQPLISIDGHTTFQFTGKILPEVQSPLFPFEIIVFNDSLYVGKSLSIDTLIPKGTKIIAINNLKTSDILTTIRRYIPGERKEYKIRKLYGAGFANWYRLVYGNCEKFNVIYKSDNNTRSISLQGVGWNDFKKEKNKWLDFQMMGNDIGYIKVRRFTHPEKFMWYIDSSFFVIKQKKIKNLIIDMTEGGGFGDLADSLLSYITQQPYWKFEKQIVKISTETKDYISQNINSGDTAGKFFVITKNMKLPVRRRNLFTGKVFILTGPETYSASTLFTAMAKCYTNATVIGQETGQPLISNGGICRHKIMNTGLYLFSSLSEYHFPCAINAMNGVKPDLEVGLTLEDLIKDNSNYLKYTLELISSEN